MSAISLPRFTEVSLHAKVLYTPFDFSYHALLAEKMGRASQPDLAALAEWTVKSIRQFRELRSFNHRLFQIIVIETAGSKTAATIFKIDRLLVNDC